MSTITEQKQKQVQEQEQRREEEPENESVLRDLELLDDEAEDVRGGASCPTWMCGANHNEVLAVTA